MHKDLLACIQSATHARNAVIAKSMSVREANTIAANNHTVLSAHAIDLRERIFLAERRAVESTAPMIDVDHKPEAEQQAA